MHGLRLGTEAACSFMCLVLPEDMAQALSLQLALLSSPGYPPISHLSQGWQVLLRRCRRGLYAEMQAVPIKKYISVAWRLPLPYVNCRHKDSFGKKEKFWLVPQHAAAPLPACCFGAQ